MPTLIELARIEAVLIESDPFITADDIIDSQYAALPKPFLDALADLYTRRDSATCWRCSDTIGYVLVERPDGYERIEWQPTSLARNGNGPVAAMCEPCGPCAPPADYAGPTIRPHVDYPKAAPVLNPECLGCPDCDGMC